MATTDPDLEADVLLVDGPTGVRIFSFLDGVGNRNSLQTVEAGQIGMSYASAG